MSDHQYTNMNYVRNNPNKRWNKHTLSRNKRLTVKDIDTLILPNAKNNWNWTLISNFIDINEVRKHPQRSWTASCLSCNEKLTLKDIDTLNLHTWNWNQISRYISIEEIIYNPNRSWVRSGLKSNKGCTEKILQFFDAGLLKHLQKNIYTFKYHTDIVVKCE